MVGIAWWLYRLAPGWAFEGPEFESLYDLKASLLHFVQTGSGAHSASSPKGTWGSFRWVKGAGP
jgi:hypothetical protein